MTRQHPVAGSRGPGCSDCTDARVAQAMAPRPAPPPLRRCPLGPPKLLAAVPAIIAPVPTIVTPILAPIPTASYPPDRDGGRAGDRSCPHDRSPSHQSSTCPSTSTQHLRL